MRLSRAERRAELEADVAKMRELGVSRWGLVWLGPPPVQAGAIELAPEEILARQHRAREQQHAILYAATSHRPDLPGRRSSLETVAPRVVNAHGRGSGQAK